MNAILLGVASLGALLVSISTPPAHLVVGDAARFAADDAEVARLMAAAPDVGEVDTTVLADPDTGEKTDVTVLAFKDE